MIPFEKRVEELKFLYPQMWVQSCMQWPPQMWVSVATYSFMDKNIARQ